MSLVAHLQVMSNTLADVFIIRQQVRLFVCVCVCVVYFRGIVCVRVCARDNIVWGYRQSRIPRHVRLFVCVCVCKVQ